MSDNQKIQELYQRLITATATEKELEEFYFLADQPENEAIFHEMFTGTWSELQQAEEKIRDFIKEKEEKMVSKPVLRTLSNRGRFRWAAAAAVLLLLTGAYFYFNNKTANLNTLAQNRAPMDVEAPQSSRAAITLANGRKIFLDSAAKGLLISEGNVQLQKLADGEITYSGSSTNTEYNTLTNPRGSRPVTMALADGTKVWLNAGSSLTYPIAFTGKERKVEVTGEAYFEVTHNTSMPFIVKKLRDDASIHVLGTHFNVNAYDDEAAMKITLLEGAVKVSKGTNSSLLKPGQQAELKDGSIHLIDDADMDEVMAWKNGKFQFGEKTGIETIMRQLSRWYDVDTEYRGKVNRHFWGSISRNVNVSQVLKMLETTGAVHFKIEGKKVIVMP